MALNRIILNHDHLLLLIFCITKGDTIADEKEKYTYFGLLQVSPLPTANPKIVKTMARPSIVPRYPLGRTTTFLEYIRLPHICHMLEFC